MRRRDFLMLVGYAAAAAALQGCSILKSKPCPDFGCDSPNSETPLLIDAHIHLFNAADLQVEGYIKAKERTKNSPFKEVYEIASEILQVISWESAPDFDREKNKMEELENKSLSDQGPILNEIAENQYKAAAKALKKSISVLKERKDIDLLDGPFLNLLEKDLGLLDNINYKRLDRLGSDRFLGNLQAATRFIMEFFQYRFISAHTYLQTYNSSAYSFDLIINHIVDYEWWLNPTGYPAPTSLEEQMKLAKKLSIHTGGRVHAFVPFDPLRQILWDAGVKTTDRVKSTDNVKPNFNPTDLIEKSTKDWGAVGVKLYPPMGFSLGGNKMFDGLWSEHSDFLAPSVRNLIAQGGFGERLDNCLTKLYKYCEDAQVPVMIHSNRSNFSHDAFDDLINPPLWNHVLKKNNINSCYAHLGGAGHKGIDGLDDALQFVRGMNRPQSRQFADTSYFSDIIGSGKDIESMTEKLETLFEKAPEDRARFGQLMYGTDWKMILIEKGSKAYLQNFYDILANLQSRHPEWHMKDEIAGVMGLNAARYLGILPGGENRNRLKAFYARNGVALPTWYKKTEGK